MSGIQTKQFAARAALSILLCGAAGGALAQSSPAPAAKGDAAAVSEVVVTGSRIRGVAPVGSTIIGVGAEDLKSAPAANVVDLLRHVPQVGGAGINEAFSGVSGPGVTSSNATRTGAINLRGVGPKATLVLFGNQRLAFAGLNGAQTDPAGIPAAAIDRVEIVADGASAIYGSDAVAGVVNFIPKTHYEGLDTRARVSIADSYSQHQLAIIAGHNWSSGGAMLVLQHDFNSSLNGRDRDFYKSDLRSKGGTDYRSAQCNPGNIIISNVSYAIPAGGVTPATANLLVPNTRNLCEVYREGDILGRQDRFSGYFSATQDVTSNISLFLRGFGAIRLYKTKDTTQGSTSAVANLTVPRSNAFFVAPPGTNPASETIGYYFGADAGTLTFKGESDYYQVTGGANITLPGDWKGSVTGNFARSDDRVNAFFALPAALTTALASSNPATAFNPYGFPNSAAVNASVFSSYFNSRPRNIVDGVQAEANGPVFHMPGGEVRLAVGLDYTYYSFNGTSYRGALPQTRTFAGNTRDVKSVYAEVFVPLVGADNQMPLVKKLDLSIAGRYDKYSDVGSTTNPKIGVNWSPIDALTLKASYGTSFKAPYLSDTLSPKAGASLTVITTPDPTSPTGSSTGFQINDGRAGLTPEEATTYSYGVEWQPLPSVKLTASYFNLDYRSQISAPVSTNVLINPIFASTITRNPTPAQVTQLKQTLALPVNGIEPAVVAFIFDGRPTNLGSTKEAGFDFTGSWDHQTSFGDVYASASGTYLTQYDVKVTPLAPTQNLLNTIYYPARFRAVGEFGWERDGWSASATAKFLNSYINNLVTPSSKVDANTTIDLRAGYRFPDTSYLTRDLQVTVEVTNIFDKDPPFVNIQGGVDPTVASLLGRMFTITLDKKW